jgi:nucleoside-diphosphate-sugar epimerase
MKVLVDGDRGNVGAVLVPLFQQAGHKVVGLDAGWYDGCDFGAAPTGYELRTGDIRDQPGRQRRSGARFVRLERINQLKAQGLLDDMLVMKR